MKKSTTLFVVGISLCLIVCQARSIQGKTIAIDVINPASVTEFAPTEQTEIRNTPGLPNLPVIHRQFIVTAGKFDSVAVRKAEPIQQPQPLPRGEDAAITTFAGNYYQPPDYYGTSLSQFLSRQVDQNQPVTVENKTWIGGKELLTIAVYPIEVDQATQTATTHQDIKLEFYGSSDLEIESISDMRQLIALLNADHQPALRKATAHAAGSLGAEYLIVTGNNLVERFKPLLQWKSMKGLTVGIVTIEEIVGQYSGVDDAERLRNYLIESYHAGTRYVLLGGDETIIPIRYAFYANTSTMPTIDLLQICDLYYGDVDGKWDVDGDGVYGEPSQDSADLYNELLVGRLPMSTPTDITNYVTKLIRYEQNPNGGDYSYLNKSLFICADQMRDYQQGVGQHQLLANVLPPTVTSNLTDLIEDPSGIADNPPGPTAPTAIGKLSEGWGIISLLIHGVSDGWVVRSNQYNTWPKSYLFTGSGVDDNHGFLPNIAANSLPGLVYSIGCNNAAFDMDAPPFPATNPCVAQWFLARQDGGAVAFVGYTRWGWVSTSWRLEKAFLEYLYNVSNNPAEALRYSKQQFPYYRDIVYGLNYFGDPEMRIWTKAPQSAALSLPVTIEAGSSTIEIKVAADSLPEEGVLVSIARNDSVIAQTFTTADGNAQLPLEFNYQDTFVVYAYKDGNAIAPKTLTPQLVLGTDDDVTLPSVFQLHQNYPNPFNPATRITFDLDRSAEVSLAIYNILGQRVKTVAPGRLPAGSHEVIWDGSGDNSALIGSGVYFAELKADNRRAIIKMALLK